MGQPGDEADFASALDALIDQGRQQSAERLAARLTLDDLQNVITGQFPRKPVSVGYRLHLILVAGAMAVLPLIYVAFVALAGWAVVYYVSQVAPGLLSHTPRNRLAILYCGAIAAPAIAGAILVLFLIKPLFFRIRCDQRRRSLTRKGEPLLFDLVDRICDTVGAPKPKRIDVDYQVNASAQPAGGIFSVATGNMVLTIGVPLIAGLTARQLVGVLTHEFGHFSQKVGMGASLIIRKVNLWFTRVVYQRDTLDEMLEASIQDSDWRIGLVLQLAQVCVYVSRSVLWCFMIAGYAISAGLMRQMEFDADRYEYGLVGSDTFEETSLELKQLGAAFEITTGALYQIFTQGRLTDDLLVLLADCHAKMPADVRQQIKKRMAEERSGWFETHPTDRERVARAQTAGAAGCFQLDRPARDLLVHYEAICKGVTSDFYRDQLGGYVAPDQLTPARQLLASAESAC